MERVYRWNKSRELQYVHNIRPPSSLADPLKRPAMPLLTMVGVLLALVVLLVAVLGQSIG
jgi:hypothetical protein